MTVRHFWRIETPGDDTLTVIAETHGDAVDYAMDYCDDSDDDNRGKYIVNHDGDIHRWVGFESAEAANKQARDLYIAGVPPDRIQTRTTKAFGGAEILWEVGAHDRWWTLLPSGVLCGGAD